MRHETLERDRNTNSSKDLWQAIQNVTGYKSRSKCEVTLPEELSTSYACSDLNKGSAVKFTLISDDKPL